MKKNIRYILPLAALVLCGCGSTAQAPLDDAYYWNEQRQQVTVAEQRQPTQTATTAASPSVEYISVRDTTVTVKIKR